MWHQATGQAQRQADEARPEGSGQETVWDDHEANLLWSLCCRGGPGEDQADHWQDAEVTPPPWCTRLVHQTTTPGDTPDQPTDPCPDHFTRQFWSEVHLGLLGGSGRVRGRCQEEGEESVVIQEGEFVVKLPETAISALVHQLGLGMGCVSLYSSI